MKSHIVISLCFLVVACLPAIVSYSDGIFFFDRYIKFPTQSELAQAYHRQIAEALVKLDIGEDVSSKAVLDQLKEAAGNEAKYNSTERAIYSRLVSLSDASEDVCSQELINLIKSILAQLRVAFMTPLAKFKRFLFRYGRGKLELCAQRIRRMNKLLPGQRIEKKLDRFFTKVLALPTNHPTDRELARHLEDADMTNMGMDVEAMVKHARNSLSARQRKDRSMTILRNFLDLRCLKLQDSLGRTLDVINLAYALGSKAYHRSKLMKLDFYNRLCLSWRTPETRAKIEANILAQARKPARITELRTRTKPKLETISEEDTTELD